LCTKSFNYEKPMLEEIRDKRDVDLGKVGRVDVIRRKLIVQDESGEIIFEEPIRDFHDAAFKGTSPWGASGARMGSRAS
jgi:coenzyme F420 hydrogenase subunit beta